MEGELDVIARKYTLLHSTYVQFATNTNQNKNTVYPVQLNRIDCNEYVTTE